MLQRLDNRAGHYALLMLVWAILCLPNLGGPGLWDIDEGNNAECAQEMYESGNFIVPSFNFKLRVDKPVLLYWLQALAYHLCGVNEFAARLPSALASLLAVLVTYELGRRLFAGSAALLAGLVLASSVSFSAAAHFANPDALLNLCTVLTLWCFWNHHSRARGWWLLGCGAASGLGMLAKGPVGIILPMAVTLLFLLWRRELRRLLDLRLLGASVVFLLVAAPWYIWVGMETKGEWLSAFLWKHNLERGWSTMENHGGPFYYYGLVLIVGLTPWSVFLGPTAWHALSASRNPQSAIRNSMALADSGQRTVDSGKQFLLCWVVVWFVFFTVVRTKLPNYILPVYPAVALLTASFLDAWRRGRVNLSAWVMPTSLACLALMGVGVSLALLIAGDAIHVPFLRGRRLPGLEVSSWLGGVFVAGAAAAGWCARRNRRGGLIASVTAVGMIFAGAIAFWGVDAVDRFKATRPLALALPEDHLFREVRVGALDYFQPSLVFYCQREVYRPTNEAFAVEFLRTPLPVYLFLPAEKWDMLKAVAPASSRLVARHRDLYEGREIVLVTNEQLK
jgi:4-amino-4-deoxy-L-arabinose transferase-like glycosyltransferase